MHLEKLEVDDFKRIDRLEFKPTKINLIVGRNNTGKTSLLEAIRLSQGHDIIDEYEKPRHLIPSGKEKAKINCKFDTGETNLEIEALDSKMFMIEFKKKLFEILENHFKNEKAELAESVKEKIAVILENESNSDLIKSLQAKSVMLFVNDKSQIYTSSKQVPFNELALLNQKIHHAINNKKEIEQKTDDNDIRLKHHLTSLLLRIFSDDPTPNTRSVVFLKDLSVPERKDISKEDVIRVEEIEEFIISNSILEGLVKFDLDYLTFDHNGKRDAVPFELMGGGFKTIIGILWKLSDPSSTNKIILMEYPDRGMHPGYINQLIKTITRFSQEKNLQFFITTHNTDFINNFFDSEVDADMKNYIEKNLSLIRMSIKKKHLIPEHLPYKEAVESK